MGQKSFGMIAVTIGVLVTAAAALPIIPGEEGFGIQTTAGSGRHLATPATTVYRVTTLNDSGPGSLRAALLASGPRTVVFEVSGVIQWTAMPTIVNPYLTIAGQTAPAPGISIHGAGMYVSTHDVLIQHIRIRVGDNPLGPNPEARDCITIYDRKTGGNDVYNVVIDHCSFTWGIDENINTWSDPHDGVENISVLHCLTAEGLASSMHPKGAHSKGFLIGTNDRNILCYANLFACNADRNPAINAGTRTMIVNNLIYNASEKAIHFYPAAPVVSTVVGNVLKTGPSTKNYDGPWYTVWIPDYGSYGTVNPGSRIYLEDNSCDNARAGATTNCVLNDVGDTLIAAAPPLQLNNLSVKPSAAVYTWILATAGAWPANRDATDTRIVTNVTSGRGFVPASVAQLGGWPTLAANKRTLQLPPNPTADSDGDGYTNLEEWLHNYAGIVEGRSGTTSLQALEPVLGARMSPVKILSNRASVVLNVTSRSAGPSVSIAVYDMRGTLVAQRTVRGASENLKIDLDHLTNGKYVVYARSEGQVVTGGFVIAR